MSLVFIIWNKKHKWHLLKLEIDSQFLLFDIWSLLWGSNDLASTLAMTRTPWLHSDSRPAAASFLER